MAQRTYRYFVKPRTHQAKEAVASMLDDSGHSAETCFHQEITVEEKGRERAVRGVFEFPDHSLLDEIKNAQWLYDETDVFVQEGAGKRRPYGLFDKPRGLASQKAVREAQRQIDEIID